MDLESTLHPSNMVNLFDGEGDLFIVIFQYCNNESRVASILLSAHDGSRLPTLLVR
jgi:hypothetical protein